MSGQVAADAAAKNSGALSSADQAVTTAAQKQWAIFRALTHPC
jgi:hypothetical protein